MEWFSYAFTSLYTKIRVMEHVTVYTLVMLIVNGVFAIAAIYLSWVTSGLRQFFMLIFSVVYLSIVGVEINVITGTFREDDAYMFALIANYIVSACFLLTLALDRLFFEKGFLMRRTRQSKKSDSKTYSEAT